MWTYLLDAAQSTLIGFTLGLLARPWIDGRVQAGTDALERRWRR